MKYQCFSCNLVKDSTEEKKYVYASSTKNVKVLVCSSCHQGKITEMEEASKNFFGKRLVLGVLRTPPKSIV
jgi:hypothetical protein